ncbi:MAG: penicillin-binding transpeptidase domain-containing protein [Thermodesulfobacteriota bacterium]|nr:penicillin-binding transpeptidase domain-containing protein [Thermodesulfobacteriota bacterium]
MRKRLSRSRAIVVALAVFIVFLVIFHGIGNNDSNNEKGEDQNAVPFIERDILRGISPETIDKHSLTIDWELQKYIADIARVYRINFAAISVMDSSTGDILALYGKNTEMNPPEADTLALDTYLAASVFKIITALAAIEYSDMTPDTTITFNGKAHTLYKNQLNHKNSRWTRNSTLAKAFALSNNIVFGKIGTSYIGERPILLTAMKMGFWQSPLEECDCTPSTLLIPQSEYNIAEMASGFNRYTHISPVHAAQIVTAIVNAGAMVRPRLIKDRVIETRQVIDPKTAMSLQCMMRRTIRNGTVSHAFRGYKTDRILKHLSLGAKSGTIDGKDPDGRRDWFAGYARDSVSDRGIAIACLIIRDDYYLIESEGLARKIIRYYFSSHLSAAKGPEKKG